MAKAKRDPRLMDRYKNAQTVIKTAQKGTPEYKRAAQVLKNVGTKYGLNWQKYVPGAARGRGPKDPFTGKTEPPFQQLTPEQRDTELDESTAAIMRRMMEQQKSFQPGDYDTSMQNAYNAVYDQFDRRNQDQFRREENDFQQKMAERGIDPTSNLYKASFKTEIADRQDQARQEAQNAATQAAYNVQQQMYNQDYQTVMAPGQIAAAYAPYWSQMQKGRMDLEMLKYKAEQDRQLAELEMKNRLAVARMGGGGGGGSSQPSLYQQWQAQQIANGYNSVPQPNYGSAFAQGFAGGAGGVINQQLTRR